MTRKLVLDLEGVLIPSLAFPELHPEAKNLLGKARKDFAKTYLWTLANLHRTFKFLIEQDLLEFFDTIIGTEVLHGKSYTSVSKIKAGKITDVKRQDYDPIKDLSNLGNPLEYVLIEDSETLGKPDERVIRIPSYTTQENHDLMSYYAKAIGLF